MAEDISGRSPLDGVREPAGGPSNAGVILGERRHLGKLVLRGEISDPAFAAAVAGVFGTAPPADPNATAVGDDARLIWTAPDEWLAVTPPDAETAVAATLTDALAGIRHAVTDASDQTTVIRLSGRDARTVIAKGCALDLHPRAFATGQAAQSMLAKAQVLLWQVDETPTYDIAVGASYAAYLWAWLNDAGREFGVRTEA